MNFKVLVSGCLGLGVFLLLVFLVLIPTVAHEDLSYSGQQVFLSEEKYEDFKGDFKQALIDADGVIADYRVLASEPPIIVSFEVTGVSYDFTFPYGSAGNQVVDNHVAAAALGLLFGVLLIGSPVILTWRK